MKEIKLNGKYGVGLVALVDDDKYELVSKYNWFLDNRGYARANDHCKKILMHRLIAETPDNLSTDHINQNKIDNRIVNLRHCTQHQNSFNHSKRKNNSSGYKGVVWSRWNKSWCAKIRFNKKDIHLGYFDNVIDGAKAYNEKAKQLFGAFAYLNEV